MGKCKSIGLRIHPSPLHRCNDALILFLVSVLKREAMFPLTCLSTPAPILRRQNTSHVFCVQLFFSVLASSYSNKLILFLSYRLGEWAVAALPTTIPARREPPTQKWSDSLMRTGLRFMPPVILKQGRSFFTLTFL